MSENILHASAQSLGGYRVQCESRGLSYFLDEPIDGGGTDTGMNPLESLMASMAACKVITARAAAPIRKIDLIDIRIETDGEVGRNEEKRRQLLSITSRIYIKANNTKEEIEQFAAFVESRCPAHNTLLYGAEMKTEVVIES
ncbi:MAG: OsmC family protein [Anaerofustis sp.]